MHFPPFSLGKRLGVAMGVMGGGLLLACSLAVALPPVESVASVDAQRYAGRWFELARLPNRFQTKCVGNVTADYAPNADGSIKVVNSCLTVDNVMTESEGRAVPVPGDHSGARLKVNFLPRWLQWFPLGRGDYWVVLLDPDYRYAVVSEPSREFMWILSRTPHIKPELFDSIVNRLQVSGYPVERLVRTSQSVADVPAKAPGQSPG